LRKRSARLEEPNARDTEWLRVAGERGWVVLSQDQAITRNPLEQQAIVGANAALSCAAHRDGHVAGGGLRQMGGRTAAGEASARQVGRIAESTPTCAQPWRARGCRSGGWGARDRGGVRRMGSGDPRPSAMVPTVVDKWRHGGVGFRRAAVRRALNRTRVSHFGSRAPRGWGTIRSSPPCACGGQGGSGGSCQGAPRVQTVGAASSDSGGCCGPSRQHGRG
jgi:hypothetical protein